jgi:hypothetical protein
MIWYFLQIRIRRRRIDSNLNVRKLPLTGLGRKSFSHTQSWASNNTLTTWYPMSLRLSIPYPNNQQQDQKENNPSQGEALWVAIYPIQRVPTRRQTWVILPPPQCLLDGPQAPTESDTSAFGLLFPHCIPPQFCRDVSFAFGKCQTLEKPKQLMHTRSVQ